ncbi:CgeB family protein [Occallatibacter riparius]|uniref:Glycosyltransferase n=1 Tax=Occallatibacter riparius TaxID=1002689 RepID=A0A9J7BZ22_9BACT|nr:glycosyltransferase [Occallatibacter riparius]UWZ86949.1 glycosyltransferase [Occallatibacter riparius]
MKIVIYGLTITSSWGNGHATTYRSLAKALAERGHVVHFVEKDVEWYRSNRDLPEPEFCSVQIYDEWKVSEKAVARASADSDVIVVGSYFQDAIALTRRLLDAGRGPILFYDIDTPITMAALRACGETEYLDAALIPHYAAYLSFTGGPALEELETRFGSPWAVPFYCSVDPELYKPTACREAFRCELSYLGTYAKDRQPKLDRLLGRPAALMPERRFLVAGPQYPESTQWGSNVGRIIHVSPQNHPAFYSSSRFTLNLTRDDMVAAGYSPSVRLFEASACGAAILSDKWPGLETFLTPGEEILTPKDEFEVRSILVDTTEEERRRIGSNARERILAAHTSAHRAREFEDVVERVHSNRSAKLRMQSEGLSAASVS